MEKSLINFFQKHLIALEWLVFFLICLFFGFHWNEVFSSEILNGWDTPGHLALAQKMKEFLLEGRISGYDWNSFGGYPVFSIYSPLIYILISSISIFLDFLGLGVPLVLVFNLFLFLGIPFFLGGVMFFARTFLGSKKVLLSLVFAFLFLSAPKIIAAKSGGVFDLIFSGLIGGFFGNALILYFFSCLKKSLSKNASFVWSFGAIFFLSCLILSHIISSVVGFILGIIFLCLYFQHWKKILGIVAISLVISSFWIFDFLFHLDFSQSQQLPQNNFWQSLFPYLNIHNIQNGTFLLSSLLVFCCGLMGIKTQMQTRKCLFIVLGFFGLLLLTLNPYIVNGFDVFHLNRFVPPMAIFWIFIATIGAYQIFVGKNKILSRIFLAFVLGVLFFQIKNYKILEPIEARIIRQEFNIPKEIPITGDLVFPYKKTINAYQNQKDFQKAIQFFSTNISPNDKIFVEELIEDTYSVNANSAILSLENLPGANGLLSESSLNAKFQNSILVDIFPDIATTGKILSVDYQDAKQNILSLIRSGITHFLIHSPYKKDEFFQMLVIYGYTQQKLNVLVFLKI